MKMVLRYLKPFYGIMMIGLSIKIFGTLVELALPYILTHILRDVVVTQEIRLVLLWGGMMILCSALACFCNVKANRMAAKVARDFSEEVRQDLFEKTIRLSATQTDRITIASLESRITTDTYNIHHFVGMMQRLGVRAPIMLVGGVIITLCMDSFLALVMLAVLPFIFGVTYFISKKGVPLNLGVQKAVDNMVRVVREDVQGMRVIKALSKNQYEHARYDKVNRELIRNEKKTGIIMGSVHPLMNLLMNMGIVGVVALAAQRVSGHLSDTETVIAFMQYFTLISQAMMSVSRIFSMYTKSYASASRISEIIEMPEELTVCSEEQYPPIHTDSAIVFDHVSFSYQSVKDALRDISFSVRKGGSIGIIGATGSGKSTLAKLLLRYYDVTEGAIYINGRDIRTYPKEEFHALFGTAMQNDFLYSDTIEENIRFGRDLTHEQIVSAAKIAQADDFISAMPEGYERILSQKGTNISGGQKQRLLISRAVATHPQIMVLDDSSSALDYKTDANLRKALAEQMKGTVLVTVAQRVSSVKNCDTILVLHDGRISGFGTHEQLLESCEEYREISKSQMGGALID